VNRRHLLSALAGAAVAGPPLPFHSILVHEHVMVDFRGPNAPRGAYDPDEVFRIAKPHLDAIYQHGCRRFLDCTPQFVGRDTRLLRRLADATSLEIWTNTGLYAARNHQFVPDFAKTETAAQLAKRWVNEWKNGVDGMKPRFVKIGVNRGPLHEIDRKFARAAALCSKETGLTVVSHTGNGLAAVEQVEIFAEENADVSKFVWVHAHGEKDHSFHEKVGRAGSWVEFDGISPASVAWHVECVEFMAGKQLLGRTLVSQDAGYYRVGEPGGGKFRAYTSIYEEFLPKLKPEWAETLLVDNAAKAFGARPPA
jgi:phosphotriesterase-related protein